MVELPGGQDTPYLRALVGNHLHVVLHVPHVVALIQLAVVQQELVLEEEGESPGFMFELQFGQQVLVLLLLGEVGVAHV